MRLDRIFRSPAPPQPCLECGLLLDAVEEAVVRGSFVAPRGCTSCASSPEAVAFVAGVLDLPTEPAATP